MEYVKSIQKRIGVDAGYHSSVVEPANREGCVGKRGIDKSYSLEQVVELAAKMEDKPNIIIKAGPDAKWYLKRFRVEDLDSEIEKQQWRDVSRCVMYVVEWDLPIM